MGMGNKIDPNIIPEYIDTNGDLIGRKVASYEWQKKPLVIDQLLEWKKELRRAIKWYREEMKGIENNE